MNIRPFLWCVAGAVLMASPASLDGQAPPSWRLTRDLRIDAAAQDLTLITPPGDMAVAPNGVIAVSQNQDGVLRFFDQRGAPLGTFGRKGQGPGEFQTTGRFAWIADTLVVSDMNTRRFTLISPDRKLVRTVSWLATVSMAPNAAGDTPRLRVAAPRMLFADGSQLLTASPAVGSPVPDWPGGAGTGMPFLRVDQAGGFQRVVGWSPRKQCNMPFDAGGGMGSGNLSIPFCGQVIEEIAPDGSRLLIAFAEGGGSPAYRVVAIRPNGDTVFARTYQYGLVPITQGARDSARAIRARGSQSQRDAAARMQIPESYPPLSRVVVGRDETTWLELYGPGGERSWHVLDGRGDVIGKAVVPRNAQVMVVSRDVIWAIETDDDGLQHIVRFRVSG